MKRLILFLLLFTPLAASAQTTYYIDYATGSNANNGTAKGTPWKSHPYMQNIAGCAGAPHSYTPVAGDQFIFKGGVTWPAACFAMVITTSGSASVQTYYGVDLTWFSGGGFTRPKFDMAQQIPTAGGGNPSARKNVINVMANFITIDNIEIANQQIDSTNSLLGGTSAINNYGSTCGQFSGVLVLNTYIHDWMTNGTFSNSTGNAIQFFAGGVSGCGVTFRKSTLNDTNGFAFNSTGNQITVGIGGSCLNCKEVDSSVFISTMGACFTTQSCHDSDFSGISQSAWDTAVPTGFGLDSSHRPHTQVIEDDQPHGGTFGYNSLVYNNLVHDNPTPGVLIFVRYFSRVFNNVMWNNGGNPAIFLNNSTNDSASNVGYVLNNTIDTTNGNSTGILCNLTVTDPAGKGSLLVQNNHIISSNASPITITGVASKVVTNNLFMSSGVATGQGYTVAHKYQAAGDTTTFAGVNLTSTATGGLAALALDAEGTPWFGATAVARPTGSTKWNPGAYQSPFSGGGTPPTVTVTAPAAGTISGMRTITVTASGGTISSIQPLVDGQTFGNACTASPCNVLWDTTKVGNGTHTVGGTATNGSGQGTATPVTVTVSNSAPGCTTSGATWTNTSFTSQAAAFTATFTVTPNGVPTVGTGGPVVGFSNVAVSAYADNAALIRQSDNGFWEAYNGTTGGYTHAASVSWIVGTAATITMSFDVVGQTYNVQVTQGGVSSIITGSTGNAFRTTVSNLAFWNLDPTNSPVTLQVCSFALGATGALTPTSFNFGSVNVGSNASQVFTLTNNGGSPLTISATAITPNPPFSATANTCTGSLASAATCQITVRFAPTSPSSSSGTIHMTTSGTVNDVTLSGTGSSLSPPSVPTGLTATPGGTSVVLNWTASTGSGPITYNASRGTTNGGPYASIATGITSTTYTDPGLANGTYYYVVSATNSAGTSVNSAQASAVVAVSPVVVISPSPLNFGTVGTGASGSLNVNVSNTGNANLTLTCPGAVAISGANQADFAITTNGCTSPVAAGSSFSSLITFTPTATGVENATLCVTSNSATSPDCIAMTGVSQGFVTVSPASLNFGSIYVRSGSSTRDVVITNNSGGTVTVSSVAVGTGEYSVTTTPATNCGGSIANAATCTAHVTFNPTSVGTKADTLTITNSAATQTVPLTGKGTNRKVAKGLL